MRELGSSGIWEIFIPGVKAGEVYKYELLNANHEWKMKADPMERSHEIPPATGSIVVESDHEWNDEAWMDHRRHTDPHAGPVSIYEVHAGSWKKASATTASWRTSSWTTWPRKASRMSSSCR